MTDEVRLKGIRRKPYTPDPEILGLLRVSGNPINGHGETSVRRASRSSGIRLTSIPNAICRYHYDLDGGSEENRYQTDWLSS